MRGMPRAACVLAASAALLTACRTAMPPDQLARLDLAPPAAPQRLHLEVDLESRWLSGVFDALVVTRSSPPAVRLQLLPDLGAPILDLVATPAAITARMHGEDAVRRWRGQDDDPPLAPPLLFAITLLEQHAALGHDRIVAAFSGPPITLDLRGLFPGTRVVDAELQSGEVVGRTFRRGHVVWRDTLAGDHGEVTAPGFRLRARVLAREDAGDVGDDLFDLEGDG
jgi:hypothetical protein